jgi:hypothetical protein
MDGRFLMLHNMYTSQTNKHTQKKVKKQKAPINSFLNMDGNLKRDEFSQTGGKKFM